MSDAGTTRHPRWLEVQVSADFAAEAAVDAFVELVADRPAPRVALATGRTYVPFYAELARRSRDTGGLDLGHVRGINLDELVLPAGHEHLFATYMQQHAFSPTSLEAGNFAIADGPAVAASERPVADALERACSEFEAKVRSCEPLDVALLGVGADGHVGYNLPGPPHQETHAVLLPDQVADTLDIAADLRPLRAITVGLRPLLGARTVILIATGSSKAEPIRRMIEGDVDPEWPCTWLLEHPDLRVFADRAAVDG